MATPPKNQVIQLGDYTDSNFETFLVFFTNLEFNKPKKISMKITNDNFNWKNSLRMKINAVLLLSDEVNSQYKRAMKVKEEMKEKGFVDNLESMLLLIKFETLLNSIYSLCDNLAFVGQKLHPGIKKMFNDQRNNIRKHRDKYPEYSAYLDLIEGADWYDKLHTMRSESTHYLPGFVFHSLNGLGILYQNMEHSKDQIEIENIHDYVADLISKLNEFLEKYGEYHLKHFINEKHETFFPCLIPNSDGLSYLFGGRVLTFSEYLNKQPGRCTALDVPCPNRTICPACQKNKDS
jgi:hypothetical protein